MGLTLILIDNATVDNISDAIPVLLLSKTMPQLDYCIEPFRCALISLILSAELIRVEEMLSTSGLPVKIKIRAAPDSYLEYLWMDTL